MCEFDINLNEIKLRIYCENYKKELIEQLMTGHSFLSDPKGIPTYNLIMYDNYNPKNYNFYTKMIDKWFDNASCDVWINNKSKIVYMSNIQASEKKWRDKLIQYFTCNLFNRLLEEIGYISFHSSCIEKDNNGIAFIAGRNSGKTNCMLNMMSAGFNSVTNDKLAIQFDGNKINAYGVAQDVSIRMSKNFRGQEQNQKYIQFAEEQNLKFLDCNLLEGNNIHLSSTKLAELNNVNQIPSTILTHIILPTYDSNTKKAIFSELNSEEIDYLLQTQKLPLVHDTTSFFENVISGNKPLYDEFLTIEELKKLKAYKVVQGEHSTNDFIGKVKKLIKN